jgi:signal transduction histidine kinase
MAAATVWTAGYAIQLCCADLSISLFLNTIEYIGIVTIPLAWLLLVLRYTGRGQYITPRNIIALSIIPTLVVIFVATNQFHHLFYTAEIPALISGSVVWIFVRGPLFWLHVTYSYLLLLAALVLLASRYSGAPSIYRRQIALLVVASSLPVIVNIFYIVSIDPVPGLDLTPLTFTLVGIIIAMGLFRYQLFLTLPVAYPLVFSAISDGIIVTDTSNRILDLNPAARELVHEPGEIIGGSLVECFPQLSWFVTGDACVTGDHREITIPQNNAPRYFDVVCRQLKVSGQAPTGYLFILRDVTDRRLALDALAAAHKKLNLLSSVTRHDMMNKVTGLTVYLDLIKSANDPAITSVYLQRIDEIARMIREEIAFTRDYQEMGVKSPVWQGLSSCIASAKSQVDMGTISVTEDCAGVELYADPLLVKVFINLLENAARHGGSSLSTIRFSSRRDGDSLIVTCEDDGTGIEEADKARLFTRGFGKHTGLGLFLSREILKSTGITIHENGIPGEGARFELTIPPGSFRFAGRT